MPLLKYLLSLLPNLLLFFNNIIGLILNGFIASLFFLISGVDRNSSYYNAALFDLRVSLSVLVHRFRFILPVFPSVFVWLARLFSSQDRLRHTYVLGASGSGKSCTLEYFLNGDVLDNHGIALIEPHSDLTERFLHHKVFSLGHSSGAYKRLVVLDFESVNPTPFNIFNVPLPSQADLRKFKIDSLVSSYASAFKKALAPEMSKNMLELLKNCLSFVFFLPHPNFFDLLKLLNSEENIENRYLDLFPKLPCSVLRNYFKDDFFNPDVFRSKNALKRRLSGLLRNTQLKKSLCAKGNAVDVREIMDKGKILVVKASKGLGDEVSRLIGNLVLQFIYDESFHRLKDGKTPNPFFCYLDECQNYISDSVISGLSEGRKFGLHFVLANQHLGQDMTDREQKAVLNSNVKICGKVNHQDSVKMANEMEIEDRSRIKRLKAGEFFYQSGHRRSHFLKFPRSFTQKNLNPKNIIVKFFNLLFSKYMSYDDHKKMMEVVLSRDQGDISEKQRILENKDLVIGLESINAPENLHTSQNKPNRRGIESHIESSIKNSTINKEKWNTMENTEDT